MRVPSFFAGCAGQPDSAGGRCAFSGFCGQALCLFRILRVGTVPFPVSAGGCVPVLISTGRRRTLPCFCGQVSRPVPIAGAEAVPVR